MGTQPAAVAYSAPAGVRSSSFVPAVTAVSATPTSYGQLPVATSMVASPYGQQAYGQQAALAPAESMAAVSPYGQQAMMVPATSMAVSPYGQQVLAGYGATPVYGFEQQVAAPGYGQEVGYATQYGDAPVYYTDATPTKKKKKGGVCC